MTDSPLLNILSHLSRGDAPSSKWPDAKGEYWSLCPFHADDHVGSFSVSERGYKCWACPAQGSLRSLADHFGINGNGANTMTGLTLADYANAKKLPLVKLQSWGLTTEQGPRGAEMHVPYYGPAGDVIAVRIRYTMVKAEKDNRFSWRKGDKLHLYGLDRLKTIRAVGWVLLVEGESDCHTAWLHDLPVLGVPGARAWKGDWATYFNGMVVYVWQEPDEAGADFAKRITASIPTARVIVAPEGVKDLSEAHLKGEDVTGLVERLRAEINAKEQTEKAGHSISRWSYESLMDHEFPPVPFVVDSLLPTGLALLVGRPKQGKSRLALQLCMSVAAGGVFLGRRCAPGETIYLALEDSPRRIQRRLREMKAPPTGLHIIPVFADQAMSLLSGGAVALCSYIEATSPRLVVIDTLTRAFPRVDWNDLGAVTDLVGPLQQVALQHNTCLFLVDHMRKGNGQGEQGEDAVTDAMGSTGKTAVADLIMGLYRKRGEKGGRLTITGRDVEEQVVHIAFDAMTAMWRETSGQASLNGIKETVYKFLVENGSLTNQEVTVGTGLLKGTVYRVLRELVNAGLATETGGKYDAVEEQVSGNYGNQETGETLETEKPGNQKFPKFPGFHDVCDETADPFADDDGYWDHICRENAAAKTLLGG